ncbi:hypothetical protein [Methylobacterium flocculans]|uniref:hypothetical protein n=1 Tax=Methylobacterium flocculans TaxID=2984843 RepID=UPI001166EF55|nr:hypothetical protein [Methylobacterium sp. FF17]GEL42918.1 hypothetical protein MEX01_35090 [Methylorubrum extorquens]
MTGRARWVADLTTSRHVHRFLTRISAASDPAEAPAIDEAQLRAYLDSLRGGADDARTLVEVMELMTRGYVEFMQTELPKLLAVLSNRTEHVREVVGPGLRGVVRWDLTKVGRANRTLPSARYISNVQRRSYETPENALLVWLLTDIERAVAQIGKRIGTRRLHPLLRLLRDESQAALRHEALSSVEAVRAVSPHMIHAARHNRQPGYRAAAALVQRRRRMQERSRAARWSLMLQLLRSNWLEPVSDDDLFEIYGLSTVLSVLSEDLGLGEPVHYGLLGSTLEPAATYRMVDATVRVWFNRTPGRVLGITSRYATVNATYSGLGGFDRRPDIMLVLERGLDRRTFLVEVKNAGTKAYLRDSVYKVFGYLHDYAQVFADRPTDLAALYVPEGMVGFLGTEEAASGMTIVCEGDRPRLASALRSGLGL